MPYLKYSRTVKESHIIIIQSSSMVVYIIRHVGKWWCMIQRTCILIKCLIDKWVMYGLPNYDDETIDEDMLVCVFLLPIRAQYTHSH